jgi:hypothetical protein
VTSESLSAATISLITAMAATCSWVSFTRLAAATARPPRTGRSPTSAILQRMMARAETEALQHYDAARRQQPAQPSDGQRYAAATDL